MADRLPLIPVILPGGVGTRLWPASRRYYPRQFLSLIDPERSLLQQTSIAWSAFKT